MDVRFFEIRPTFLLLICVLFGINQGYSQNLNGVFLLSKNNESYYVHIKNKSFELFSLQSNPAPEGKSIFVLRDVGYGLIKKEGKNLIFGFDSILLKHQFFSTDSLTCSMYTNQSNASKVFDISMQATVPEYNNTILIVEGNARRYDFLVKGGRTEIEFPDSIIIKNVYLSIMGYGKRQLPYVESFNTFRYTYFLNDLLPQIEYLRNTVWTFPITSQDKDQLLRFSNNNYMKRMDESAINLLKRLSNENDQINEMIKNWF